MITSVPTANVTSANLFKSRRFSNVEIDEDLTFVDFHLIDTTTNSVIPSTTLLPDINYIGSLWLMYDLGNELTYSFVWDLNIN